MAASNKNGKKVRSYYLVLEKLFKKYTEEEFTRQMEEKDKQLESLVTQLKDKQSNTIKAQKSLLNVQKNLRIDISSQN